MRVFDDFVRTDESPYGYTEDRFQFYNRSARPAYQQIRDTLDSWFSRYPAAEQSDMLRRLNGDFPFFELFLHELLLRLGCNVEVHPDPGTGSSRRPDFLVTDPDGQQFFLEAVLATDLPQAKQSYQQVQNSVLDVINTIDSPNFLLGVRELVVSPTIPPSERKLRKFLGNKLSSADPDEISRLLENGDLDVLPKWIYEEQSTYIEVYPIPKSKELRGGGGGTFGVGPITGGVINSSRAIRKAVTRKATGYGELPKPYVIAVNALGEWWWNDNDDVLEALYGDEVIAFYRATRGPSFTRERNGAWISHGGPVNTRVSAVLVADAVNPPAIRADSLRVFYNPWAVRPLGSVLQRLSSARLVGTRMEYLDGDSILSLLGLPPSWPEPTP